MKKESVKKLVKAVVFLLPLGLTIYGYLISGEETFLNAAFKGVAMYVMGYGDTPPNLYVEIARWLAPLATASGVILAFMTLREKMRNELRYLRGGSIAVYGDGPDADDMLAQLKRKGIRGPEGRLVHADRYILMFEDEKKNYDFYRKYPDELTEKQVYIKSSSLRPQDIDYENLHFFQYEEAEARVYWKKYSLLEEAERKDNRLKVVLIGGGKLGQSLLTEGLQKNIFHPDQEIEYHMFYAGEKFAACHPGLKKMGDPVLFHGEEWYQAPECLRQADRILVTDRENEVEFLNDLLALVPQAQIDIFSREGALLKQLFRSGNIRVLDAEEEGRKLENVLNEELFSQAKQLNLNYAVLYGSASPDEESREREWRKLNAFTKYSNVSSMDYHEIRMQMLQKFTGSDSTKEEAYLPYLELFAELEHIRWCRYHFLNDWSYGVPADGKAKDPVLRIHHSLIPYSALSEEEKEKDRETVRCMFQWQEKGLSLS